MKTNIAVPNTTMYMLRGRFWNPMLGMVRLQLCRSEVMNRPGHPRMPAHSPPPETDPVAPEPGESRCVAAGWAGAKESDSERERHHGEDGEHARGHPAS